MKKNAIIIIIASLLYLAICLSYSMDDFQHFSRFVRANNISRNGDYTNLFNQRFISRYLSLQIDDYDVYTQDAKLINLFDIFDIRNLKLNSPDYLEKSNLNIYVFSADEATAMMRKYNISNPKNIDYTKTNYVFPFGNEKYRYFLGDFSSEKNTAKKISTDKNGNPIYDYSPDAVVFFTIDDKIQSYIYIDSRLVDTRNLFKYPKISQDSLISQTSLELKKSTYKNSGNAYYFDWETLEDEEKFNN